MNNEIIPYQKQKTSTQIKCFLKQTKKSDSKKLFDNFQTLETESKIVFYFTRFTEKEIVSKIFYLDAFFTQNKKLQYQVIRVREYKNL